MVNHIESRVSSRNPIRVFEVVQNRRLTYNKKRNFLTVCVMYKYFYVGELDFQCSQEKKQLFSYIVDCENIPALCGVR